MRKYRPPKCCVCNAPGKHHCDKCRATCKEIAASRDPFGTCLTLPPDREATILAMTVRAADRRPLCPDADRRTVFREAMRA